MVMVVFMRLILINFFNYFPKQLTKLHIFPNKDDYLEDTVFQNAYKIGLSYQEVFDEFYKLFKDFYKMDLKTSYMSNFLNNNQFLYKTYDITYDKLFLDVYSINRFLINKKTNTVKFLNKIFEDLDLFVKIKEGNNEVILFLSEGVDFSFDGDFDFEYITEGFYIPDTTFQFDGDFDFEFTGEPIDIIRPDFLATTLSFPLFNDNSINNIYKLNFILTLLKKIIPATTYIRIV